MLYMTKDAGSAIGEVIAAISQAQDVSTVEIRLTQDSMTTLLHLQRGKHKAKKVLESTARPEYSSKYGKRKSVKSKTSKTSKASNTPLMITCEGETMSAKDWATKLHVSDGCIRYRAEKYGNPYGHKGPTDNDKIIAGS